MTPKNKQRIEELQKELAMEYQKINLYIKGKNNKKDTDKEIIELVAAYEMPVQKICSLIEGIEEGDANARADFLEWLRKIELLHSEQTDREISEKIKELQDGN